MRSVFVLRQAAEEAEAAAAWYEREQPGLGSDFSAAVDAAIDLIEDGFFPLSPMPGQSGSQGAKRLVLRRFPYDIIAIERGRDAIIVAVAHHSRQPGYWRERIRS